MDHYVGLDVSLEQTAVCVIDGNGKTLWQGKCASNPEALAATICARAPAVVRIGLGSRHCRERPAVQLALARVEKAWLACGLPRRASR
jgi:predicted NBD/HSP70 family sugar kinase